MRGPSCPLGTAQRGTGPDTQRAHALSACGVRGCPARWRVFSSSPGLCPSEDSSGPPPSVTATAGSGINGRHPGAKSPWLARASPHGRPPRVSGSVGGGGFTGRQGQRGGRAARASSETRVTVHVGSLPAVPCTVPQGEPPRETRGRETVSRFASAPGGRVGSQDFT